MAIPDQLSLRQARRLALVAQGLHKERSKGIPGLTALRSALDHIQVLQLDAVNVLARTQLLVLFSRVGGYDPALLGAMACPRGELLEYWAHAAALVPMAQQPLFRQRMDHFGHDPSTAGTRRREWARQHDAYIRAVLDEVAERGPLAASGLSDPRRRQGEWWDRRSDGRRAMEWLFATGALAAWRSPSFERLYDLPEQVVPPEVLARPTPDPEEARRQLLAQAAGALGVGRLRDLADYYFISPSEARLRVAELEEANQLQRVRVEGWEEPAWMPGGLEPRPLRRRGATLLSPFDSLIWQRNRNEALFGFSYRIEIYVPGPRRVYGYYVLPLLLGEQLVGRFDLKSDRQGGTLLVGASYVEDEARAAEVAAAAAVELRRLTAWLGLERVEAADKGNLAPALRRELAAASNW